LIILYVDRR